MQVFGNYTPLDCQCGLDHAGNACSRFQVADVGFHGTGQERMVGFAPLAIDFGNSIDLNRIAHGRSGPMGLEEVHVRCRDARLRQRLPHHLNQRRRVGNRESHAGPAVVHRRAPDDPPDAVAVRLRLIQPFQHHHPATFTPYIAVRGRIEGLALPVRGQHHRIRAQFVNAAVQQGLHAAGKGQVRLALLQVRHGIVDGHQG